MSRVRDSAGMDAKISNVTDTIRGLVYEHHNKADGEIKCSYVPYTCLICDTLVKPSSIMLLKKETLRNRSSLLEAGKSVWSTCMHDEQRSSYMYEGPGHSQWMDALLLSPRGVYIAAGSKRFHSKSGFVTCSTCYCDITRDFLPMFAIANNNMVGTPPKCLTDLTELELALITPVKSYGYIFTYTGGQQTSLKGVLAYYKVQAASVARAVAQLNALPIDGNNVVFLVTGRMTSEQKKKAMEKSKIDRKRVLHAIEWLTMYHKAWKGINMNEISARLPEPIIYTDGYEEVESTATNVERTESFSVYYPDGTMNRVTGGQVSVEEFKDLVHKSRANPFDVEFRCDLERSAVPDYTDDHFVNTCLLQFPYGRGGMNETRQKPHGSRVETVELRKYVQHLSLLSQPHFHHALFVLKLYSIYQRQAMLNSAFLRTNQTVAAQLANELTSQAVKETVSSREVGRNAGTNASRSYIDSINAIAKVLPHTNAAAGTARLEAECVVVNMGMPSYFVTVTADTDASWLMQVFALKEIDDDTPVEELTESVLRERYKERHRLRIEVPGLSAYVYELLMEVVTRDILGWDFAEGCATEEPGVLGECEALTMTTEEQGRKKLHAHLMVFIKGHQEKIRLATKGQRLEKRLAREELVRTFDSVATTKFFPSTDQYRELQTAFNHDCPIRDQKKRKVPEIVGEQELRNLRHKSGYQQTHGKFAFCPNASCLQTWTHEELVHDYLKNTNQLSCLPAPSPELSQAALHAMIIQYQKPDGFFSRNSWIINAAYNAHLSSHVKTCFKSKAAPKRYGKRPSTSTETTPTQRRCPADHNECRYRFPASEQSTTHVNESRTGVDWYSWTGLNSKTDIIEVIAKRGPMDAFQNVSFVPVSEALTCNSNIAVTTPGPLAMYTTKYTTKKTQNDDCDEYRRVYEATQKLLSTGTRRHESDRSEALRVLLRGSHAHNNDNVVSAPMAAYLTRNGTRFKFSHTFAWVPMKDIESLLRNVEVDGTILYHGGSKFFCNSALHYLCRPQQLEDVCVFDFFKDYEVVSRSRANTADTGVMKFLDTVHYVHPSNAANRRGLQGARKRTVTPLIKLSHYMFPDSALFGGSILDPTTEPNAHSELYARLVLTLFFPIRCDSDLNCSGSHVSKLCLAYAQGHISPEKQVFLQNLQDVRANALRLPRSDDDLRKNTVSFGEHYKAQNLGIPMDEDEDGDEDDELRPDMPPEMVDAVLDAMDDESYAFPADQTPLAMSFRALRNRAADKCGYEHISKIVPATDSGSAGSRPFLAFSTHRPESGSQGANSVDTGDTNSKTLSRADIIRIVLTKTSVRSIPMPGTGVQADICEANGTAKSIVQWGRAAGLDTKQRRAFEIAASTFVLSFYKDAEREMNPDSVTSAFLAQKQKLLALMGITVFGGSDLVMFLHGPGGSGKTTAMDLLMAYAKEYCLLLEQKFTKRTIVITAMSGVAATVLLGETTHSALYLNQQRDIDPEQVALWRDTRLVIVDEISFAKRTDVQKIEKNLRLLRVAAAAYGGLPIILSGDLRQLEPIGADPLYKSFFREFHEFVNCYIELEGMHRFKNDLPFGEIMRRWRNGDVTRHDIQKLNDSCWVKSGTILPENLQYATFYNRDRDAINTAVFEEYCDTAPRGTDGLVPDTIVVLSDNLLVKSGAGSFVEFKNKMAFWEKCGESDCKLGTKMNNGRVDPALKLYLGCPVMLTENHNVPNGIANGTRATVQQILLKPGETVQSMSIAASVRVRTVFASQVERVILRHVNDRIQPTSFEMQPQQYSFGASMPLPSSLAPTPHAREIMRMKATQLPFVSNSATTGHKLQGITADQLFISYWKYATNWAYVVTSRVRTMKGLYFRKKLDLDLSKYEMPAALRNLLQRFNDTKQPQYYTEEQYDTLFD